jgi:glycosyltransferase involved in cell wall biosynthesis
MPNEASLLAACICKLTRRPLVTQILGDWGAVLEHAGRRRGIKPNLARWLSKALIRNSRLVFAQGNDLYSQCRSANALVPGTAMVHSTLTDDVFYLRESANFHRPVRILSVMGLVRLKRPDILLAAVTRLLAGGFPVEWWCVGDGPERHHLELAIQRQGLVNRVRLMGYQALGTPLISIYREADIFVHSSMTEGVPLSLLEAMANSLPVVATSAGGIPSTLRGGKDGLLVPPGDAQPLADAVVRLVQDPSLTRQLSRSAYYRARDFHSQTLAKTRRNLIATTFGGIAA